jgi:phosphate transport system substrate-binding protein
LPLTRVLAQAFTEEVRPDAQIIVHESIGSSGGLAAARDGAIDLGLVSRPLHPHEMVGDTWVRTYARVAVVFAANPSVPRQDLSPEEVLSLYAGDLDQWPDRGKVVVLQRERGDSSTLVASQGIPGFEGVDESARSARRWRVLYHDRTMQEALISTPGAVGLFDHGAAVVQHLPLKILAFGGVRPTAGTVLDGRYPLHKPLSFVAKRPPVGVAAEFIDFVFGERGQALIRDSGYAPARKTGGG